MPLNGNATKAVSEKANSAYRFRLDGNNFALRISFDSDTTEVTLGSEGTDIYLPNVHGTEISKRQCMFTYAASSSGAIVLNDTSRKHTTEIFDRDFGLVIPFSQPSYSVVVSIGLNRHITIGQGQFYCFEIRWQWGAMHANFLNGGDFIFGPRGSTQRLYIQGDCLGRAPPLRRGRQYALATAKL